MRSEQAVRLGIIAGALVRPFVDVISLARYMVLLPVHLLLAVRCMCSRDEELRSTGRVLLKGSVKCTLSHFVAIAAGLVSVIPVTVIGLFSLLAAEVGLVSASLALGLSITAPTAFHFMAGEGTEATLIVTFLGSLLAASAIFVVMAVLATSGDEGDE